MVVHHTAFFKGDAEVFDELAVEHIGLCAVDDTLHFILVGCGEHFFGRDIGQEHHAFFALAGGTLPHGPVGQTHGQVSAVAALKMHAFQIEGVHFVPQGRKTLHVGLPLVDRVAAGHAADIENELPQRIHSGVCIQLREYLLRPWYTRQGRNGPLHTVIHGVLLPGLHKGAAGGVHPADLIAVKVCVQFRVVRDEVQHADAALALGIVQIAAQLPRLQVGQGFLAAQLHAGAGHSIIRPVHLHIPCTGFVGAAHAQPGKRGPFQRAVDDKGLARLRVHAHPDDEIGIFFQQFVKVFHGRTSCGAKCIFVFSIPQSRAQHKQKEPLPFCRERLLETAV